MLWGKLIAAMLIVALALALVLSRDTQDAAQEDYKRALASECPETNAALREAGLRVFDEYIPRCPSERQIARHISSQRQRIRAQRHDLLRLNGLEHIVRGMRAHGADQSKIDRLEAQIDALGG